MSNLSEWKLKHPNYMREYCQKNKDRLNAYHRQWRARLRLEVLSHYSGDIPHCACCGESHSEFLCIDHINGGGNKHRKRVQWMGNNLYSILKREGYPDGYRVLCHNCNMALGFYGYCPHLKNNKA